MVRIACAVLFYALITFFAVPAFADVDPYPDTYGKSGPEILAMGQGEWYDFFTARAGESTMAMSDAYRFYAEAAHQRNAALPQRNHAAELNKLATDFGEKSLDIAYNFSGGGTLWIPMYGQMACDAEEVTYALLGGEQPAVEPMMTGPVNRAISKMHERLELVHADPDSGYFKYDEAIADLKALRRAWKQIKALADGLSRADSDRVLGFCNTWATALEIGMEGC